MRVTYVHKLQVVVKLAVKVGWIMSFNEVRVVSKRRLRKEMRDSEDRYQQQQQHFPGDSFSDCKSNHYQKKDHMDGNGSSRNQYPLVSYWELPEYMKDNEFILNYYRANWPLKKALFSVFRWHNETLNVWTHLIGFILFLGLTLANFMHIPQVAELCALFPWLLQSSVDANVSHNFKDTFVGTQTLIQLRHIAPFNAETVSDAKDTARWPFFVFLGGAMFCLLSSSICHLFSCHSRHLSILLLRIDYVGITVMIIASFFPQIYYIFQCEPHWQLLYLGVITAMGIFTIVTLLTPALSTGKFRAFRATLFCSMGLFGIIPAIHAVIVNWGNPERNVTLAYESTMALSYLTGTLFYVCRVPERWKPGWFDLAGHSHQIFHALVVMGALAHYAATLIMLNWREKVGCDNS